MVKKKIILVTSSTPKKFESKVKHIPINLLYLASALKDNYKVKVYDLHNKMFGLNQKQKETYLKKHFTWFLKKEKPDCVGISAKLSVSSNSATKIASTTKKALPKTTILLGGQHATLFPKHILKKDKNIDYIVLGEGEESIVKLLNAIFNKKSLKRIDGIAYRKNEKIIVNPKTSFIKNLDSISFPAYELIKMKDYYMDTSKWHNPGKIKFSLRVSMISSRGCPNKCNYCAVRLFQGQKYRMRSAKNVVDEIELLYKKYNCKYITFLDDNLTVSKKRVLEMTREIIKRKIKIQFDTSTGIDIRFIDDEMLNAMVKAGFIRTAVGIEVGSEKMRFEALNKNMTNKQIYSFFKIAKKYKQLKIVGWFMYGFPQETKQTLNATFNMIKRLPLSQISLNKVIPFYGTELYNYCHKNDCLEGIKQKSLSTDFSDGTYQYGNHFIKPEKVSINELEKFRNKVNNYLKENKMNTK